MNRNLPRLPAWTAPLGAMLTAAGLRIYLLFTGSVPFNSDEAVVGLMARHILQGSRPVFFYGQAYLGSLDAWLVAVAYRLSGEGVPAIRVVQLILYLIFMLVTWRFAQDAFKDSALAGAAVWLLSVPAVFVTTYTTASLGGYGELMVLGMLVIWLANMIANGRWQDHWLAWSALGFAGGMAFWATGLSIVFLLPAGAILLFRVRPFPFRGLFLSSAAFLTGSSPWWLYNLAHEWSALTALSGQQYGNSTFFLRLSGLFLLGLPTLADIRFPWQAELAPPLLLAWGLIIFIAPFIYWGLNIKRGVRFFDAGRPDSGAQLIALMAAVFLAVYLLSRFGVDATGRYLLPLYMPVTLLLAWVISRVGRTYKSWGAALLLSVLVFHGVQTARAAFSKDGLTTQFDPITRFNNRHDAELIDFLERHGETRGYSHYWVAYRLAFLSQESLIFTPKLPYKANLELSPQDDRLPAYSQAVDASLRTAYILTENPNLEERVLQGLKKLDIQYEVEKIGPYRIIYRLSQPVRPWQLGFGEKP